MRFSATTLVVTALAWASAATAHSIQLKAHSRECFHETLHKDDLMTVTFQVGDREFGGSGNLDIDFWVGLRRVVMGSPGSDGYSWERCSGNRRRGMSIRTARHGDTTGYGWTKADDIATLGRGSPPQPPILQAGRLQRRLLLYRTHRRQIQLLLQQRGLDVQLQGGLFQCPRYRLRAGVGDVGGSSGGRR